VILQDNIAPREGSRESINHDITVDDRGIDYPPDEATQPHHQLHSPHINHVSPSNTIISEFLTADLASIRWLDLLAQDALQANRGFTRPSSPAFDRPEIFHNLVTPANEVGNIVDQPLPSTSNELLASDHQSWQLNRDIVLKDSEILILRNFVEHSTLWLDLFDPNKHFSVYTTRLAVRISLAAEDQTYQFLASKHRAYEGNISSFSTASLSPRLWKPEKDRQRS